MKVLSCLSAIAIALAAAGCGESEVSTDPAALEAAFQDAPAEATAEVAAPAEEGTTDTITMPAPGSDAVPVRELATRAASALKKDEYSEAMVLLQTLRRARNLSPEQLTAVQDQMASLQSDLANKAAAGDLRAKQALELIQQSTRW